VEAARKRLKAETAIVRMDGVAGDVAKLGDPVALTCPDCGGPILEIADGGIPRYRCQVGHGFTAPAMLAGRLESVERELWHLVSSLEEAARVAEALAKASRKELPKSRTSSLKKLASRSRAEAKEILKIIRRSV
jgi:two-component system, chemotaxis family, protein-glutamate methylesterase/glutaminase